MRSTHTWWKQTKSDPERLIAWLYAQYRGEATAAARIEQLRDAFARDSRAARVLTVIAAQERKHAGWVSELLRARGCEPLVRNDPERYWPQVLRRVRDLETGCAIGAHAERMRLERIEVIASDAEAPRDVREVFQRILREERFHERAFRALTTPAALAATRDAHDLGRAALGLHP